MNVVIAAIAMTVLPKAQFLRCVEHSTGASDQYVIALNGAKGTLFWTQGVERFPTRQVLTKLVRSSNGPRFTSYSSTNENSKLQIRIPTRAIGIAASRLKIFIDKKHTRTQLRCYSTVRQDS